MTDRELMQQALENCRLLAAKHRKEEWAQHILRFCEEAGVRPTALRARLAQPEQEPVAWELNEVILDSIHDSSEVVAPPQREWQGLTDEEIDDEYFDNWSISRMRDFARAIEAKLREKNT